MYPHGLGSWLRCWLASCRSGYKAALWEARRWACQQTQGYRAQTRPVTPKEHNTLLWLLEAPAVLWATVHKGQTLGVGAGAALWSSLDAYHVGSRSRKSPFASGNNVHFTLSLWFSRSSVKMRIGTKAGLFQL